MRQKLNIDISNEQKSFCLYTLSTIYVSTKHNQNTKNYLKKQNQTKIWKGVS